jgi:hypothetical protein
MKKIFLLESSVAKFILNNTPTYVLPYVINLYDVAYSLKRLLDSVI